MTSEDKSVFITLGSEDQKLSVLYGHQRNDDKEKARIKSNNWTKLNDLEAHVLGVGAEIAVARYLRVPFHHECYGLHGDKGHKDLEINGVTIEVKCRQKQGYEFALSKTDPNELKAQLGVLSYSTKPWRFELIGYIARQDFIRLHRIADFGFGPRATVCCHYLEPISTLRWAIGLGDLDCEGEINDSISNGTKPI